jgi:hypothetical protein
MPNGKKSKTEDKMLQVKPAPVTARGAAASTPLAAAFLIYSRSLCGIPISLHSSDDG